MKKRRCDRLLIVRRDCRVRPIINTFHFWYTEMPRVIIDALINLEHSHFNKFCVSITKNILVIIAAISQMPETTSLYP